MDKITRIFIETSKSAFQLHGVIAAEEVVLRRQLSRGRMAESFGKPAPRVVGMEACGEPHWARVLSKLGHEVKLIAPQHVRPYVKRSMNHANDAAGGCEAMSRPTMGLLAVETADRIPIRRALRERGRPHQGPGSEPVPRRALRATRGRKSAAAVVTSLTALRRS